MSREDDPSHRGDPSPEMLQLDSAERAFFNLTELRLAFYCDGVNFLSFGLLLYWLLLGPENTRLPMSRLGDLAGRSARVHSSSFERSNNVIMANIGHFGIRRMNLRDSILDIEPRL
jgi:hypothetical protein